MPTAFETEPCTRCGGAGKYSFNGQHSRCYKCDDKNNGRSFTKRGRAAKDFYLALRLVMPCDVKIGDVIKTLNFKQLTVAEISKEPHWMMRKSGYMGFLFTNKDGAKDWAEDGRELHMIPTQEQNAAMIHMALVHQSSLTKTGTPRKR
jgi:hypothetical protein